ncbi:hypothetical protein GCM10027075_74620 [Streptomyces heilongjiangensis]
MVCPLLQQVGTVAQDDPGRPGGVPGGEHRPLEALSDQAGKVAAMVQMGMGDHHRMDRVGIGRLPPPVAAPQLRDALEQPAVHHDPRVVGHHQELGSGHRTDPAEKAEQPRPEVRWVRDRATYVARAREDRLLLLSARRETTVPPSGMRRHGGRLVHGPIGPGGAMSAGDHRHPMRT